MQWTVTQTSAAGQWTGAVVGDKPAFIAGGGGGVGSYSYGSRLCCRAKHQTHSNIRINMVQKVCLNPGNRRKGPFSQKEMMIII